MVRKVAVESGEGGRGGFAGRGGAQGRPGRTGRARNGERRRPEWLAQRGVGATLAVLLFVMVVPIVVYNVRQMKLSSVLSEALIITAAG